MDTLTAFSVVAFAALIHASFQLGVSMVTLLSHHTAGNKLSATRSLRLVGSFLGGTVVMTTLIVSFLSYLTVSLLHGQSRVPDFAWAIVTGIAVGIGLAIWLFYYRGGKGTPLWLPRGVARFLHARIADTTLSAEAFSLGLTSVFAELIFIIAPASSAALALVSLPPNLQLVAMALYVVIASFGMIVVTVLIGSGHRLSQIQRWREQNKRFLQFAAGSGLIVLGFYLYANQVVAVSTMLTGGQ